MSSGNKELVRHSFHGGRFSDHGMDVDALPELLLYKRIIAEVAKALWKTNNPERQRLPKNIDFLFSLKFYSVEPNCATIPLSRNHSDQKSLFEEKDELDHAVELVCRTIDAASNGDVFPETFPKYVLPMFADYGRTLQDDEWIEHKPFNSKQGSRFDYVVRERLIKWVPEPYVDHIDIIGSVTTARVLKKRMAIQFEGKEVEAEFTEDDEEKITSALRSHATTKLRVVGKGQFDIEGKLQKITHVESFTIADESNDAASHKPIWETISEIMAGTTDEQFGQLPADGATKLDDYLYGNGEEQ